MKKSYLKNYLKIIAHVWTRTYKYIGSETREKWIYQARAARKLTQRIRGAYLNSVSGVRAIRVGMCAHY